MSTKAQTTCRSVPGNNARKNQEDGNVDVGSSRALWHRFGTLRLSKFIYSYESSCECVIIPCLVIMLNCLAAASTFLLVSIGTQLIELRMHLISAHGAVDTALVEYLPGIMVPISMRNLCCMAAGCGGIATVCSEKKLTRGSLSVVENATYDA